MARNSKLIKIWFKEQSNFKLAIAAIIFIALCYVLFGWKYDKEYNKEVISEIRLAQNICENSLKWVSENTKLYIKAPNIFSGSIYLKLPVYQ